jgi:hypothetical protein
MRNLRFVVIFAACVLVFSLGASAGKNEFGVADKAKISFEAPTRIGGNLLPAGQYTVLHTMDGTNHVMVFKHEGKRDVSVKVKCTLVPLGAKAPQTQQLYVVNASNERELHELIFRGDTAKHVFE